MNADVRCCTGRMIIELQTSLALIQGMTGIEARIPQDKHDRKPFKHVALEGLNTLTEDNKRFALQQRVLADLGESYGLHDVLRWKPRKVSTPVVETLLVRYTEADRCGQAKDVKASGIGLVTQQALYAIIGAISLQRGGQVANEVVRERILKPLGLYETKVTF